MPRNVNERLSRLILFMESTVGEQIILQTCFNILVTTSRLSLTILEVAGRRKEFSVNLFASKHSPAICNQLCDL